MKSLPRRISFVCSSVRRNPRSVRAVASCSQLAACFSTNTSTSWVVSENPSRIAPDFPKNRYFTPCLLKTSRTSSAFLYSNPAITQPIRHVLFAPLPVFRHGVEGTIFGVIQHRFVGVNERIANVLFQRPACRRFKILPILRIVLHDLFHMPASSRPGFSRVHYARESLFLGTHDMKVRSTIPMAWHSGGLRQDRRHHACILKVDTYAK